MRLFALITLVFCVAIPAAAGTLVVCNKYEGTVSFVNLDTGEEVVRTPTGPSPHEVTLSPDQTQAVVVSYLEDGYIGRELNVFDIATGQRTKTIPLGSHMGPHGIAWISDTGSVLVTTEETRDVIKVDIDAGLVTDAVSTDQIGSHLLALSPDATRAYVTSRGSDTVSVIDVAAMTLVDTITADEGPEGVDVSPDNGELWVANNQSQNIIVFNPQTMERIDSVEVGFLPIRVRFNPAGDTVAVADLRGDRVVFYDRATRGEIAAVDVGSVGAKGPASLLYSPDGLFVYAGAQDGARVVEIDAVTHKVTRVFNVGEGADGLAISPVKVKPAD